MSSLRMYTKLNILHYSLLVCIAIFVIAMCVISTSPWYWPFDCFARGFAR